MIQPSDSTVDSAPHQQPLVVLLCSDLMLTSSVSGAARQLGVLFISCSQVAAAAAALCDNSRRRLFVDLGTAGLELSQLTGALSADDLRNAVAYGPHVHESLLSAAREIGIGTVMSRGQFNTRHRDLIRELAESSPRSAP